MPDGHHMPRTVQSDCGRVSVTVATPGGLPRVALSGTATRLPAVELARLIVATAGAATGPPAADAAGGSLDDALHRLRALRRRLREAGLDAALAHGREQLAVPTRGAEPADAHRQAPTRPVSGPAPGAESLDRALALLEGIREEQASRPADEPEITGYAASADGSVRLLATADRPIAELSLSRAALTLGPTLLAEEVNSLVEAAAADLRDRQNRALAGFGVPINMDEAAQLPDRAHAFGRGVFAQLGEVHAAYTEAMRRLHRS